MIRYWLALRCTIPFRRLCKLGDLTIIRWYSIETRNDRYEVRLFGLKVLIGEGDWLGLLRPARLNIDRTMWFDNGYCLSSNEEYPEEAIAAITEHTVMENWYNWLKRTL